MTETTELLPPPHKSKFIIWFFALILLTPVILFYLCHFITPKGIPTGFIQTDMPSYIANGREHFDGGSISLFYSNPYSIDYNSVPIYFQPHIFVLGFLVWLTNINPGIVFCMFGFIAGLICIRVLISVFEDLYGLDGISKWLTVTMLCWGGGITFLLGAIVTFFQEKNIVEAIKQGFRFDANLGWGLTNFGRNLINPMESYYHILSFLIIWSVFKKKQKLSSVLLAILSISHPFTGIQMILIVLSWQVFEVIYLKNKTINFQYIIFNGLLAIFHLTYYLWFLGRNPEHRSVTEQWASYDKVEKMGQDAINFVPALILVFILFFYQIRTPEKFVNFFQNQKHRFLAIFSLVSFVLANHEFAIEPMQPTHFDRGYIWIPLCLMGAGTIISLFDYLKAKKTLVSFAVIISIFAFFVFDNVFWFTTQYNNFYKGTGFVLSKDDKEVIEFVKQNNFDKKTLLVSNENRISYILVTYTPIRTLIGHPINSPFWNEHNKWRDDFFKNGIIPEQIIQDNILILVKKDAEMNGIADIPKQKILENETFIVYKKD